MEKIHPDTQKMLDYYKFQVLPVEGTFYKSTYCSKQLTPEGAPQGTAMIGMYSDSPMSLSCFHRLPYDEVWHFYGGDPFRLILLYPDGSDREVIMGSDPLQGQSVQFVIPAGVWQAGCMLPGGRYGLFGCTMAPGFTGSGFEAGTAEELIAEYPSRKKDILRLSVNGQTRRMPENFSEGH